MATYRKLTPIEVETFDELEVEIGDKYTLNNNDLRVASVSNGKVSVYSCTNQKFATVALDFFAAAVRSGIYKMYSKPDEGSINNRCYITSEGRTLKFVTDTAGTITLRDLASGKTLCYNRTKFDQLLEAGDIKLDTIFDKEPAINIRMEDTYRTKGGINAVVIGISTDNHIALRSIESDMVIQYSLHQFNSLIKSGEYTPTSLKNYQNEEIRKTETVNNRERAATAIVSSRSRQIASSSRLIGNPQTGYVKKTGVRNAKISRNTISA